MRPLYVFAFLSLLASCSKDDAAADGVAPADALVGTWRLTADETQTAETTDGRERQTTRTYVDGDITLALAASGNMNRDGAADYRELISVAGAPDAEDTKRVEIKESGTFRLSEEGKLVLTDDLRRNADGRYLAPSYDYELSGTRLTLRERASVAQIRNGVSVTTTETRVSAFTRE